MPKLAVFPKAFMHQLCKDGTMQVREWIELACKLDIDGLEWYAGFLEMNDERNWTSFRQQVELHIRLIEKVSGLSNKEIMELDATTIQKIGSQLFTHYNKESKQLTQTFELNGVTYKFMDVHTMTFGQFVDIDTFLKKDDGYRIANLNELMAYMYCEEGITYAQSDFKKRIEAMSEAPAYIVEPSLFFLSNLEMGLLELTQLSSKNPLMFQIMKMRIALASFGDIIRPYHSSLRTKFGKLIMLLLLVLLLPLITCRILLTSILKKKG